MARKKEPEAKRAKRERAEGERIPTSFWLDDETESALDRLTQELGMNRSAVVREGIRRMASNDKSSEVRRLVAELERAVTGGLGS